MWWFKALPAAGLITALAACGFQPLYKQTDSDAGVTADMAHIRVYNVKTADPEFDRLGQQMHGMLVQRLNPDGTPASPRYRLETDLAVNRERTGIQITEEATRARLTVFVRFRLIGDDNKTIYSGSEYAANSYNIGDSQFATLTAEQDAARRAVREISESIKLRLGIYFQRQRSA